MAFDYAILEGDFTWSLNVQLIYHIYVLNLPSCFPVDGQDLKTE